MSKVARFKELLYEAVKIARSYGFNITPEIILERYNEPHRYWHTPEHLNDLFENINELYENSEITYEEYEILLISTIFHDIVYDPKRNDNEEKSVEYMMSTYTENDCPIDKIKEIIIGTKTHISNDPLSIIFNKLDANILDSSFGDMLDWENKIYKEYEWAGQEKYKKGRIEFLQKSIKYHPHNSQNIRQLIDYLEKIMP